MGEVYFFYGVIIILYWAIQNIITNLYSFDALVKPLWLEINYKFSWINICAWLPNQLLLDSW